MISLWLDNTSVLNPVLPDVSSNVVPTEFPATGCFATFTRKNLTLL